MVETEFLLPDAFKAYSKVSIEDYHVQRPNLPAAFKLKDYCPGVFRDIRRRLGLDSDDFKLSVVHAGEVMTVYEGQMYLTANRHYAIKILSQDEVAHILKHLRSYQEHIISTDGQTLLPHMLALHRINFKDGEKDKRVYMLITRNIFACALKISEFFALKGYKGSVKKSKRERKKDSLVPHPLYDSDFRTLDRKLCFSREVGTLLREALTRDMAYLMNQKLVEYTLVVGFHRYDDDSIPHINTGTACHFVEGIAYKHEHYFIGFSDIGQSYNAKKAFEHAAEESMTRKGKDNNQRPEQYTNRILEFIKTRMELIDIEENDAHDLPVTFIDDFVESMPPLLDSLNLTQVESDDDDIEDDDE